MGGVCEGGDRVRMRVAKAERLQMIGDVLLEPQLFLKSLEVKR